MSEIFFQKKHYKSKYHLTKYDREKGTTLAVEKYTPGWLTIDLLIIAIVTTLVMTLHPVFAVLYPGLLWVPFLMMNPTLPSAFTGMLCRPKPKIIAYLPHYQQTRVSLPEHPVVEEAIDDWLKDKNKELNKAYWKSTFNDLFPAARELILSQKKQELEKKDYLARIKEEKSLLERYPIHKEIK